MLNKVLAGSGFLYYPQEWQFVSQSAVIIHTAMTISQSINIT